MCCSTSFFFPGLREQLPPSPPPLSHSINFFFHPPLRSPAPARALFPSRMAEETVAVAEAVADVPAEGGAEATETVVVVGKRPP